MDVTDELGKSHDTNTPVALVAVCGGTRRDVSLNAAEETC